jgi:hemin uptake protein HemP
MSDNPNQTERALVLELTTKNPRTISSHDLLGSDRLVIIRRMHDDYRLQLTAAGKLILAK